MADEAKFSEWAILELMGHRKLAGLLSEQQIAGAGFLRIDIPELPGKPAVHHHERADGPPFDCSYYCEAEQKPVPGTTQFYPPSSVYGITPTTEATARVMAAGIRHQPINRYEFPQLLPSREEIDAEELEEGLALG